MSQPEKISPPELTAPSGHALSALVDALYRGGATVPSAIASAIVVEACAALREEASPLRIVALEHLGISSTGALTLAPATGEGAVCEPMVDLGIVLWELFAGRRFCLDDVLPGGDVPSLVSARSREGRAPGSLERRVLAEVDPIVARATALDPSRRFPSFDTFSRAMSAAVRPASPLRVAAWRASVSGARGRDPLVTPSPPSVRPVRAPSPSRRTGFDALDMLADLAPLMPPARQKSA